MTSVIRILLKSRFISLPSSVESLIGLFHIVIYIHVLNFTAKLAGSLLVRGSIFDSMFMPSERALGGMRERNNLAGFDLREKGLKETRTSVRNRVIIVMVVTEAVWRQRDGNEGYSGSVKSNYSELNLLAGSASCGSM